MLSKEREEAGPPAPGHRTFVTVEGVSKRFGAGAGSVLAIDYADATIEEGEFVSLLGPSGCGKSTLMKIVAGLVPPTTGKITIRNEEVKGPFTDAGIVFQRDLLLDWRTVLDNIFLQIEIRGLKKADFADKAHELLSLVGLEDFEHRSPRELSGGMRQRAAICRALVHDPELLLMDEPFGALDALTRDQMGLDLQRIWLTTGKTALFITHSISEAVFLSDRVLVMGQRPSRIEQDISIDLERPRTLDMKESAGFGTYAKQIRTCFEEMGLLRG